MNKKRIKPTEMLAPIPAVMVSVGDMNKSNIITIAWTGIVNSDPPYTYISVRKPRFSHDIIEKTGEFVINLTNEALAKATDYCGVKSGRDVDKFKETGLTKMASDEVSCPMIAEAPVNLECKVISKTEFPSHDMFIAEIVAVHVNEDLFEESGRIALEKAGLVSFVHGDYIGLKRHQMGFFGYSVAKPKTLKRKNKEAHEKRVAENREKRSAKKNNNITTKKTNGNSRTTKDFSSTKNIQKRKKSE